MKITSKQFSHNIANHAIENLPKISLVFGDDTGMVKDLCKKLEQKVANGDELAIEHISAHAIIENSGALYDSAFAMGMFSSLKIIVIDDYLDLGQKAKKANDIFSELLDIQDRLEDTYIIIPALSLENTAALVKKYEKDSTAACVRCFVDSNFDLKKVITDFFAEQNKELDPKAIIYLQNSLGNNRLITLQELEKLNLYTLNAEKVSLQDCLDCIVSADSVNIYKFCDSIGLKNKNNAQKYLFTLIEEGYDYPTILAALIRHLKRILTVKSASEKNSTPISAEMMKLRPPVFIGKDEFEQQVNNLDTAELNKYVLNFAEIQANARLNPQIANVLVEEIIFNI